MLANHTRPKRIIFFVQANYLSEINNLVANSFAFSYVPPRLPGSP